MHLPTPATKLRFLGWVRLQLAARPRLGVTLLLLLNCVALIATEAPPPPPSYSTRYEKQLGGLQTILDDAKTEASFQITVTPGPASPNKLTDYPYVTAEGTLLTSGTAAAPAWVDVSVTDSGPKALPHTQRAFSQFKEAPKLEFPHECSTDPASPSCEVQLKVRFVRNPSAFGATVKIDWSLLIEASLTHFGEGVDIKEPLPWDVRIQELAP